MGPFCAVVKLYRRINHILSCKLDTTLIVYRNSLGNKFNVSLISEY